MTKKFLIVGLLFLGACATEEKQEEPKTYSPDTNRAFEMIERGGSYYLKQAPKTQAPPQVEAPAPKRVVKKVEPEIKEDIVIDDQINYQEKAAPTPKVAAKVDERLIEINQHLAFYCMKHRSDATFGGDESACLRHVNKVQKDCQKKHRIVNSKLLSCIKTGLKR